MANKLLERPLKQVNTALHEILMDSCVKVAGDFMEMGVYNGFSFKSIYGKALKYKRTPIAIDTFTGMPLSPIRADNKRYPVGMNVSAGVDYFKNKFPKARVHVGLVPDILPTIKLEKLAFVHLDIDHEFSTYPALKWAWERLTTCGILIVHDFGFDTDAHASRAVKRWIIEEDVNYVAVSDNTIFFRKGIS
jgi:hypothetical protein